METTCVTNSFSFSQIARSHMIILNSEQLHTHGADGARQFECDVKRKVKSYKIVNVGFAANALDHTLLHYNAQSIDSITSLHNTDGHSYVRTYVRICFNTPICARRRFNNVRTNIGSEHVAIVKDDGNNLPVDRVRTVRARTYVRVRSQSSPSPTATHVL